MKEMRRHGRALVFVAAILQAGCALTSVRVTGSPPPDPTSSGTQSETAVSVNFLGDRGTIITATYNEDSGNGAKLAYTDSTRTVFAGTSLLGWSYSKDMGQTWTYGGKVSPPPGWGVLWGDPAITNSPRDQDYVFISNLAGRSTNFPPTGVSGDMTRALNGACVARSTDGGITFQNYECLTNEGEFYDGGSMTASSAGEIFAAYWNVGGERIDVWRSPDENGHFGLLPTPFPGLRMDSHPLLRYDAATNALLVGAQDASGVVVLNRYRNGNWEGFQYATYAAPLGPTVYLSDRSVRTANAFSFDVGWPSTGPDGRLRDDTIRIVYVQRDGPTGRLYLHGTWCNSTLAVCGDAPEWGTRTAPGGDQFSPLVRALRIPYVPPDWSVSYSTREDDPTGNVVGLRRAAFGVGTNGTPWFFPLDFVDAQVVCPDTRGYAGDYDDLQPVDVDSQGNVRFIRTFTDSTQGCVKRWAYTAEQQHVSSVVYP